MSTYTYTLLYIISYTSTRDFMVTVSDNIYTVVRQYCCWDYAICHVNHILLEIILSIWKMRYISQPCKYYQILLDLLTIRPWRDHGSDRNASGTLVTVFFVCHSVLLGTSSSVFIYILPMLSHYHNHDIVLVWYILIFLTWRFARHQGYTDLR